MNVNRTKKTLITIGLVLLLTVLGIIFYLSEKTRYNDENADGNTPGNLYNNGLFCQLEDKIYFSNLADDGALYSMDTDLSTYKKLNPDKVNYINACGSYIIYNRNNNLKEVPSGSALDFSNVGVYRIKLNGHDIRKIDKSPSGMVHQYGNDVYYIRYHKEDGYSLYVANLNGDETRKLYDQAISCAMIDSQYIYFTGVTTDHSIYRLERTSGSKNLLKEGNYSQIILNNSSLYALNAADNYSIVKMNTDGTAEQTIVKDRVVTYNLTEDGKYLFYQVDATDHNGVYLKNLATGEQTLIQSGDYQNLCLTKDYLFFNTFDKDSMYYVELKNPTTSKAFLPEVK